MDKVVLITGAAGSIGAGICQRFKNEGYIVVATDKKEPEHDYYNLFIKRDLYRDGTVGLVEKAYKAFGRLDVLVNNAGKTHIEWMENYKHADFDEVMKVNVYVPFELTQEYVNLCKTVNYVCRIVNVSSMGARYGLRACTPYSVSKAGLVMMTRQLARELADRYPHFRLFCVSPNTVGQTAMIDYCAEKLVSVRGFKDDAAARKYICQTPFGELETIDEVVESIFWLASKGTAALSGTNIEHIMGAA